ncbi:MAG: MFS transporter [Cloacibacillus sp.]
MMTNLLYGRSRGGDGVIDGDSGRQSKRKKIVLLALGFFFMFGYSNVSYLLPIYYANVGFTQAQSGLLVSAFYFATLIFRLLLGSLLVRSGFKRFFAIGGALTVAASLWIVFAGNSFVCAFAARFMLGAGTAFSQIALATYQSLAFDEKERGFAFSLIMAGGLAPMMTVVPFADWLLSHGHFTSYILIPMSLAAAMALLTVFVLKTEDVALETPKNNGNIFKGIADCFKIPGLSLALFSMFLFSLTDAASAFMASMTSSYGLMASYFLSTNAVIGVAVRLFFGKVLDRYPRKKLSVPIIAGMSLMLLFASIHPSRASLMALGLLFGVGMGFGFPLHLALVSDNAPKRVQPQAIALMWFFTALDFALVPLATSYISAFTTPVVGFRAVVLFVLAGAAFAQYKWRRLA